MAMHHRVSRIIRGPPGIGVMALCIVMSLKARLGGSDREESEESDQPPSAIFTLG
jgi:hypothetical protein